MLKALDSHVLYTFVILRGFFFNVKTIYSLCSISHGIKCFRIDIFSYEVYKLTAIKRGFVC